MAKKVKITDLVLRDAHQSLHATRMTTADMLPICEKLDSVGYDSLEGWGGATFDSCIRFLNEDPWERLRKLHKALPKTPIMMLLRGQNLLGYRHYADDVVDKFVEAAARNGIGVFRIFDACSMFKWLFLMQQLRTTQKKFMPIWQNPMQISVQIQFVSKICQVC